MEKQEDIGMRFDATEIFCGRNPLLASFSGELKQPDFFESFQGSFEMNVFDIVGSATTAVGVMTLSQTPIVPKSWSYSKNQNTASGNY